MKFQRLLKRQNTTRRLMLSLFFCTSLLIGCNDSDNDKSPPVKVGILTSQDCWTPDLQTLDANCGTLTVSQSYNDTSHSGIRKVGYAVLPAIDVEVAVTNLPLVFLIGGPGPAGTSVANDFAPDASLAFMRKKRQVIIVDYRGVGSSEPALSCEALDSISHVETCSQAVTNSGMAFSEMQSAVFARDVNQLLAALGHSSALLYGGSYGTRLALTILRDVPERVSGVVLDGVFPVEANGFSQGAIAPLAGLGALVKRCEMTENCPQTLGDMRTQIEALVAKWTAASIDDENKIEALISLARLAYHPAGPLLVNSLQHQEALNSIDALLQLSDLEYSDGELGTSTSIMPNIPESLAGRVNSNPMALSVVCAEEALFMDQQPLEDIPSFPYGFSSEVIDLLRPFSGGAPFGPDEAKDICEAFGAPSASTLETAPVISGIPTLILNGGMDMQTSFAWGNQAAVNLSQSTNVLIPLADHITIQSSSCAQSIMQQFMDNPASGLDTACAENLLSPVLLESEDLATEF